MSRHEITSETVIAAPASRIYEIVSDPKRIGEWMPNVEAAKPTNAKKGVGATRTIHMRMHNTDLESHQVVVEAAPGKRFAWEHQRDLVNGETFDLLEGVGTAFDFKADGKSTKVTATAHFTPKGFKAKLAAPLFTKDVRKQIATALENVKRIAESK